MAAIQISQVDIAPGQRVCLSDVIWAQFKDILEDLGEHRAAKVAYNNGKLEIMLPSPGHEDDKEIIGDLLKHC